MVDAVGQEVAKQKQTVTVVEEMRLDAHDALKGYQMFVFALFLAGHPYVRDEDFQEFAGQLTIALCGSRQQQAIEYQTQFNEYRDDISMLSRLIAIPIADHLTSGESHYEDREFVARFIPMFTITTQIEIAREFRDKPTLRFLECTMQEILQGMRLGHS